MLHQLQIKDIRSLQVFNAVVDAGGISAAQQPLDMTQSNISGLLLDLEARLGVTLCERGRGGFRVTAEGEEVYATTRALVADLADYTDRLQSIGGGLRGQLLLGHMDNYISHPDSRLVQALGELAQLAPEIYFNLRTATLDELAVMLTNSELHLAIGTFRQFDSAVDYHLIHEETQLVCCATQHALATSTRAPKQSDVATAGYAKGLFAYGEESRMLENCVATVHQLEGMVAFILSARGVGYIPDHIAKPWIERGQMQILLPQVFNKTFPVYLAVRRKSLESPLLRRVVDTLLYQYGINRHE